MNEHLLISIVAANHCLYDRMDPKFKDLEAKENVWIMIASTLHRSVDECKMRWATLRQKFSREKKLETEGFRDTLEPVKSRWRFMKMMRFLDKHVMPRKTFNPPITAAPHEKQQEEPQNLPFLNKSSPIHSETEDPLPSQTLPEWFIPEDTRNELHMKSDHSDSLPASPSVASGSRKRKADDHMNQMMVVLGDMTRSLQETTKIHVQNKSADALFGESVGAELSRIQNEQQKDLAKCLIWQVISKVKRGDAVMI